MALPPADMVCFALYSTAHAMQQAYRPLLEELGVTYPQYLVMSVLWTSDGAVTVGGIGRSVNLDSSTLTPLLKRLEAAGLLVRSRDPRDERQVRIELTGEGAAMKDRAAHIPRCIMEKTGLDIATLERLRRDVSALGETLRSSG